MPSTRRRFDVRPGPAAFRAAPSGMLAARPTRPQALALLAVLALVTGTVVAASYLVRPDRARSFELFHGSVLLADSVAPVAVDLASGRPTVRLIDADDQVGARSGSDLAVTPMTGGTLLLNRTTGEFNVVAATGFVVKTNGGVPIAKRAGSTGATAISSGNLAYIEQTGPTGTSVYLVGQTTVETASNVDARVRPRAFRSMTEAGSTEPGAAASAGGSLWLLLGSGDRRVVRRLEVPPNSSAGATLRSTDHGRVDGPAALASAGDVVGVASAGGITVYRGSSVIGSARFPAVTGLDRVLAATNGQGRLSFLFHGSAGWSVASIGADGRGLRGPTRLTGLPDSAELSTPAASGGSLYTMDTTSGQLVRIGADEHVATIPGAASYPLAEQDGRVVEPGGFGDGYVIARGPRVIYNSPTHLDALVVFTDGSHRPVTVEKSSAVSVSAAGGAESLTRSRVDATSPRTTPTPTTRPKADSPVNDKIDCKTIRQKPHIPTITTATPGSRSVALSWTYPLLSTQDCAPSTYRIDITLVSADAPSPPSSVTVQGQQSVNLAGLFPSTQYEISAVAFINGQGTGSAPRLITTGPEGPAAPKDVRATTDSGGDWNITWSSCGSGRDGCVAASSWKVVPEFCDGQELSGAPPAISVTADPTSVDQPPAQLRGNDALLGRGVRFQVEGIGAQGAVGRPSSYTACTYSWSAPVVADISVAASTPPNTSTQSTSSTTATVTFAKGAVHDLGGVGGDLTYQLLDSSGSVVTTEGPTTSTSATLNGVRAGTSYSVRVVARPPRHPQAAVTTPAVPVDAAIADWPVPQVSATFTNTDATTGSLSVTVSLPDGTDTRGETFDLSDADLTCGQASYQLTRSDVRSGQTLVFDAIPRATYNSLDAPCSVTLALVQDADTQTDPPLFGASASPSATSATVPIDPPSQSSTASDFHAQWGGSTSNPQIVVTYDGGDELALASNWVITATNATTADCGTSSAAPTATIEVEQSCISQGGRFTVSISYDYLLSHVAFTGIAVSGDAPQPIDPSAISFTAAWSTDQPSVTISYTGSQARSDLAPLAWTETVTSNGVTCGTSTANPADGDPSVAVDLGTCPVADATGKASTYSLDVSFTDPVTGTHDYTFGITGTPHP